MPLRTRVILHVLRDILRSCAVTSEKDGTSLIKSPEKKGIRVERYSHKYPSVAKIHHYQWNRRYSFVAKIHHYLRCTSWLQNPTCLVLKREMFYFVCVTFSVELHHVYRKYDALDSQRIVYRSPVTKDWTNVHAQILLIQRHPSKRPHSVLLLLFWWCCVGCFCWCISGSCRTTKLRL